MESFREQKLHGSPAFPFRIYRVNLPEALSSYPLHWHDEFELIYVVNGNGIVTVQHQRYVVHAGDLVLIQPQFVHSIEQHDRDKMEYYNILFHFSLLDNGPGDPCYEKYLKPLHDRTKLVEIHLDSAHGLNLLLMPYVQKLIDTYKQPSCELIVKSQLFGLLHHLSQHSRETGNLDRSLQSTYERLKNVLSFVHTHYAEPISIAEGAAVCGFSESHFRKLFRELTGASFTQYIKSYRLEKAAVLLLETSMSVTEIADQVGFHNYSYFSRAFAQVYQVSPLTYRKRCP
ncbi:MAG: AraC family transcriptional regulator [Oscillospiraceae bacterium]|nr:AraC family transcriptional regulator [Oscillospiraceae bacterium]